jgi:hypothetical protein
MKEEDLKKKWINFKIDKDKEQEKNNQLLILQGEFRVQRSKRKPLLIIHNQKGPDSVYVSDMDFENCCNPEHHRVQKFNSNGGFLTKWGGNGQFINPMGIAIDSTGNVYVADQVHQLIKKFTNDGTFITSWSSGVTDE